MSPVRPDLVECWIYRLPEPGRVELLLIRRSASRIFPGLWQCVTGGLEAGERVPMAALREVAEEVGFGPPEIEAFYDLDQVTHFYDEGPDALVSGAIFAVRVRADAIPRLSHEHDGAQWVAAAEALRMVVWPSYRLTIERILGALGDPAAAPWFELTLDGRRTARPPREG
jgi:8-oxo-dGTP pyrophosphatase MutT (NUDIX family)